MTEAREYSASATAILAVRTFFLTDIPDRIGILRLIDRYELALSAYMFQIMRTLTAFPHPLLLPVWSGVPIRLSYPYRLTDFYDILADYALVPSAVCAFDKQPDDFL